MFRSYTFLTEFLVSYMNSWFHINDNVNYAILSWILIENCCFLEDHFSIFIFWKKFWWKLKFQRNLFFFGEQALKPCRTFYIPIIKLPWPLAPELSVPPSVEHTNEIFTVSESRWQWFSYHLRSDTGSSQELGEGASWTAVKSWAESA